MDISSFLPFAHARFRDGVLPILAASCLWGGFYFICKYLLASVSPIVITGLVYPLASVFLLVFCRIDFNSLWRHFRAQALLFIGLSLTGALIGTGLMMAGLSRLDLGVATLLEKLQPVFTLLMAAVFLKERLLLRLIPYSALALVASYLIAVPDPLALHFARANFVGIAAVVGASFSWGISSVIGRRLAVEGVPSTEIVVLRNGLLSPVSLSLLLFKNTFNLRMDFSPAIWALLILIAVSGAGYGYILYYKGLKHVDAPTAGFLELATPLVALALGLLFFGERLSVSQWFAVPALLFSVWRIASVPPAPGEKTPGLT